MLSPQNAGLLQKGGQRRGGGIEFLLDSFWARFCQVGNNGSYQPPKCCGGTGCSEGVMRVDHELGRVEKSVLTDYEVGTILRRRG